MTSSVRCKSYRSFIKNQLHFLAMPTTETLARGTSLSSLWKIDDEHIDEEIMKPYKHICTSPGKNLRQNLIVVLNHWIQIPHDKYVIIDELGHSLHTMSLLLDDIQDNSFLRRGAPAAHTVYGIPRTLIAVEGMVSTLYGLLESLGDRRLTLELKDLFNIPLAGQGMEIYWRDSGICPTEAEYLEMVYRKTCRAFMISARIMNHFTTKKPLNIDRMLKALGLYFQINDDYLNLTSQTYFDSKGFCDDISEGKFSFPIVHAINNFPEEGQRIKDILELRTTDIETKKVCLAIIKKCGSFEYTKSKLDELKTIVFAEVPKFETNPYLANFIERAMLVSV